MEYFIRAVNRNQEQDWFLHDSTTVEFA